MSDWDDSIADPASPNPASADLGNASESLADASSDLSAAADARSLGGWYDDQADSWSDWSGDYVSEAQQDYAFGYTTAGDDALGLAETDAGLADADYAQADSCWDDLQTELDYGATELDAASSDVGSYDDEV